MIFDDSRVLISVVSDEQLSSTREDLLGYPVHSHSELTLLNKVAVGQDTIQRPTGLVSESIFINGVSNIQYRSIWLIAYRSLRFITEETDDDIFSSFRSWIMYPFRK